MCLYYREHNKEPVNEDPVMNKSGHKKTKHKHIDCEKPESEPIIQPEIPQ